MAWDDGYREAGDLLRESLKLLAAITEEGPTPENATKMFNAALDKEREGWRRAREWHEKTRVPTKYSLGKAVYGRELLRLTLSVMLLRAATKLWFNDSDFDDEDYGYYAEAAKEQALLSLTQLREASALRPRHLMMEGQLIKDLDEHLRTRFVPAFNACIRRYNQRYPEDQFPLLTEDNLPGLRVEDGRPNGAGLDTEALLRAAVKTLDETA